jgi:hypothetical protein
MANTQNNPPGPFAPYDNTINESDSLMKRVPFPKMDIGANSTGLPSGLMKEGPGSISHVGTGVKSR